MKGDAKNELRINDGIAFLVSNEDLDQFDTWLWTKIVGIGTRDGQKAYIVEYPDGKIRRTPVLQSDLNSPYYKVHRKVVPFIPAYDMRLLNKAYSELTVEKANLVDCQRWVTALDKARAELLENPTIRFTDRHLYFISRTSGKRRFVTENGCHRSCDCGGQVSYHIALFEILNRYFLEKPVMAMAA